MKKNKKYYEEICKIRVKCNCGHTLYFPVYAPDVLICSYCGHKVYRNECVKFKEQFLKFLKSKEVDENVKSI